MSRYYLTNLIGNPLDTSIAIASVIFGGVLQRFPNLKFCFAHGGGFVPYQRGRLTRGFRVREEARVCVSRPPDDYLRLVYFDTILHSEPALKYLVSTFGADRVMMGSDCPFDMSDPSSVDSVNGLRLGNRETEMILHQNAIELFRLDLKEL